MQERLVRGYIYQLLKERYNLSAAVIVTTAIFMLMHSGAVEAGAIPVINIITMCLLLRRYIESESTILAPIMAHSICNIIGALILGGVSLTDDYPSMFAITSSGNILLSGCVYNIESSIVVTLLNVILTAIFYIRYRKGKRIKIPT